MRNADNGMICFTNMTLKIFHLQTLFPSFIVVIKTGNDNPKFNIFDVSTNKFFNFHLAQKFLMPQFYFALTLFVIILKFPTQ